MTKLELFDITSLLMKGIEFLTVTELRQLDLLLDKAKEKVAKELN